VEEEGAAAEVPAEVEVAAELPPAGVEAAGPRVVEVVGAERVVRSAAQSG
jgi:hypothetical protein